MDDRERKRFEAWYTEKFKPDVPLMIVPCGPRKGQYYQDMAQIMFLAWEGCEGEHKADFNIGYTLACSNLVNLHDQPGIAADVMAQAGISWEEVEAMGLTEYDMKALREIKEERASEPFKE